MKKLLSMLLMLLVLTTCLAPGIVSFAEDEDGMHFVQAVDKASADRNDIVLASATAAKMRIYAIYTTRRSLTPAMRHMGMYGWR